MTPTQGEHAQTEALDAAQTLEYWAKDLKGLLGSELLFAATKLRSLHAQVAALTAAPSVSDGLRTLHDAILNRLSHAELLEKAHYLMELNSNQARTIGELQDLVEAATAQPAAPQGVAYAELKYSLWVLAEHNALHFGENHSTVMQARQALAALRASNGQAPAGAYKDSTPGLHVGDSSFESWYSGYKLDPTSIKQIARDAYAAGMGDPLVTYAPTAQAAPAGDLPEEQTQPWYDLAWRHGARRHTSFDGDELTELSFSPTQFDAFCADLAPAAGAVAHTLSDAQIEAMPVWRNFVGLWPESRREIVDAVLDLLATAPTPAAQADSQPAPVVGRMSPSKEWLETRLAIADDCCVQAGVPPKNARPCDAPPGCNSHNCLECNDYPRAARAPADSVLEDAAWMPIATAPAAGLILLVVEDSEGERRVFPAEASHENGGLVWMVTLGWLGWKRLHSAWTPILWCYPPVASARKQGGV